jgi:hypothetical protein
MTVTHFQLFFQRPRAPKREPKWEPKWSLRALKIIKIKKKGIQKTIKNTTLQKVGYWLHFEVKMGILFRGRSAPKITTIPEILKMGPRASKMGPRASKMTKNHDSDLPKSRKSHCKPAQNWHGGGLCAQRTGYICKPIRQFTKFDGNKKKIHTNMWKLMKIQVFFASETFQNIRQFTKFDGNKKTSTQTCGN